MAEIAVLKDGVFLVGAEYYTQSTRAIPYKVGDNLVRLIKEDSFNSMAL